MLSIIVSRSIVLGPIVALLAILLVGCNTSSDTIATTGKTDATVAYAAQNTASANGDLRLVPSLPAADNTQNGTNTPIAVGDLLEVKVFQVEDLNREVRVEGDGAISLPLIGRVPAAGQNIKSLERSIASRYGQSYLQSPEVSVLMKESMGERVTMEGAFMKPGIYPTGNGATLLRSVALASGLTPLADETKIFVYRSSGGQKYVANYSLKDIRAGLKSDPRVYGGDIVVAFQSNSKIAMQNLREALGIASSAAVAVAPF